MQEKELRLLASRNVVRSVVAVERTTGDGFDLVIDGEPLQSVRKDARRFASLDSAVALLRDVGVGRFQVQLLLRRETVARQSHETA
jgi:hypothetical protein